MSTTIIFVRHGKVENTAEVYYGRLPHYPLSTLGRQQAARAAEALKDTLPAAIFSSPLLRARQTAQIIASLHPGLRIHTSSLLLEVSSPFDGRPIEELKARHWDVYTGTAKPYEQPGDVLDRAKKFTNRVRRAYPGQTVVAVTHGDLIALFTMCVRGVPIHPAEKEQHYPAEGSLAVFTFEDIGGNVTVEYRNSNT